LHAALLARGAVPRFVGPRLGRVSCGDGGALEIEVTLETTPSVLYDALAIPSGSEAALSRVGQALEFIKDQYRHCKSILAVGQASKLLKLAGIPPRLPDGAKDPGLVLVESDETKSAAAAFEKALSRHRHPEREADPPLV
jgi:catalase